MKKSRKPLTFTAGVLLTVLGMTSLYGCDRAHNTPRNSNAEIGTVSTENIGSGSFSETVTENSQEVDRSTEYIIENFEPEKTKMKMFTDRLLTEVFKVIKNGGLE